MPYALSVLRADITDDIDDDITVYLNTGDPGADGLLNRVAAGVIGSATITATTGWTLHATLARATAAADPSFGDANGDRSGISWISMFKGSDFFASRALDASVDVIDGQPVRLDAATVVLERTSVDA